MLPTDGLLAAFDFASSQNTAQQIYDLSGNGNHMMVGSTTGVDTNDFTLTGTGAQIGTDDFGKLTQAAFDNLVQFTVITRFTLAGYGPINQGRIWDKSAARYLRFTSGALSFFQNRTTSNNSWSTASVITLNTDYIVGLSYNGATPDISPIFRLGTSIISSTKAGTGAGDCASDAATDLAIGNTSTAARNLDGIICKQVWYNKILSDAEYAQAYDWVLNGEPSGTIAEVTATTYASPIYAIPFRAGEGIRTESGIILPVSSDVYRIGQGSRIETSAVGAVESSATRAGQGIRAESSTVQPVASLASRIASAVQTVVSWVGAIVGRALALFPVRDLHAKAFIIERKQTVTVVERDTTTAIKTRLTKTEVID